VSVSGVSNIICPKSLCHSSTLSAVLIRILELDKVESETSAYNDCHKSNIKCRRERFLLISTSLQLSEGIKLFRLDCLHGGVNSNREISKVIYMLSSLDSVGKVQFRTGANLVQTPNWTGSSVHIQVQQLYETEPQVWFVVLATVELQNHISNHWNCVLFHILNLGSVGHK